jgi:hypothetical protein
LKLGQPAPSMSDSVLADKQVENEDKENSERQDGEKTVRFI